ncbi:MAG TPA: AraC family transcriptional regulator [Vicinamibacterales bacterium]|nr:AraC family transcriptional regulator [Vicinamibacterales bacterium]
MAKIAAAAERASAGRQNDAESRRDAARRLAAGHGWTVTDVVCSRGPWDRPYDERHEDVTIAIVTSGTFQYRGSAANGRELMTPGSLLLGSPGQHFECGHEHGDGDRCLSFQFSPEYFAAITAGAGAPAGRPFRSLRLPAVRPLSPAIAEACAALGGSAGIAWEDLAVRLAVRAVQVDADVEPDGSAISAAAVARVTRTVRLMEAQAGADLTIVRLAREARLSPFHYLRVFESLTGVTPHQYLRRSRLRTAAARLAAEPARIVDIVLGAGFGDVSNFNRAFRTEFGVSPGLYRRRRTAAAALPSPCDATARSG